MEITALAIPLLVFGAVTLGVFTSAAALGGSRRLARRLRPYTVDAPLNAEPASAVSPKPGSLLRDQRYSNWALLDQMIARRSWAEAEAAELTRANLPLRVGEYLLLRGICALGFALLAAAGTGVLLLGVPAAAAGSMVPRIWVKLAQRRRQRQLEDQLVEAVTLLASTLRSGYSFLQGMEAVAREMPPPISQEFNQLIKEIAVGARADEALLRLVERCRSNDLELVVTAIMIQRTVGGELAGILETIVRTVRERQKIQRDVSTLTAQQRWSGYVIGALPVFLVVVIGMANRSYVDELLFTPHGHIMLGAAMVIEAIGFFMIRRIIAIEV